MKGEDFVVVVEYMRNLTGFFQASCINDTRQQWFKCKFKQRKKR